MEQVTREEPARDDVAAITPAQEAVATPAACPTCAGATAAPSYVYALGKVEVRFPNLAAEKEFAQATGRADTAGKTDRATLHAVLSKRENRYLVRQLCWVLTTQGLDTYILVPRDPADVDLLVEALRPDPSPNDLDVVIGLRGPRRPAGDVQRAHGAHRGLRPDLLVQPRRAARSHPAAGEDVREAVRPGGGGGVRQDPAAHRQRRGHGRAPGAGLPGRALSRHVRQGHGAVRARLLHDGRRRPPLAAQRHAARSST